MPRRTGYGRGRGRGGGRRRLVGDGAGMMVPIPQARRSSALVRAARTGARMGRVHPAIHAAMTAYDAAQHATRVYNKLQDTIRTQRRPTKALKQTTFKQRGAKMQRHEKLKQLGTVGPLNKGKGFNRAANGRIVTHGKGVVPKWKSKRLGLYKYDVWQTILLSKSNRLAASNNVLETYRYPIKAPECLDSERVQSMVFQPFCSHFSGIHSTLFRKVASSGTDIDHDTSQRLDVIQNKADIARHELPSNVDGSGGSAIVYESDYAGGAITAGTARGATNVAQINKYYDQLVKRIKCDLVFTASRAFPVQISVSVVRMIDATSPYELTGDDKKMLLNNLDNKGMEYSKYKTEWLHEFTLPALKVGKDPPHYSVNKILDTNFLQTNTFEKNNVAEAMAQSATTQLGKGIDVRVNETSDGDMSGAFVVLIKYRKVQKPQQFTYSASIQGVGGGISVANVEFPAITEDSFDIPNHGGESMPGDGSPFDASQGDESKASFYVHGKLITRWGFRRQPESIPSIVSSDASHADYKKAQSLMIDPTYTSDDSYGIYTESPDHVQLAANTSTTGP